MSLGTPGRTAYVVYNVQKQNAEGTPPQKQPGLAHYWHALTEAERVGWEAAAKAVIEWYVDDLKYDMEKDDWLERHSG